MRRILNVENPFCLPVDFLLDLFEEIFLYFLIVLVCLSFISLASVYLSLLHNYLSVPKLLLAQKKKL